MAEGEKKDPPEKKEGEKKEGEGKTYSVKEAMEDLAEYGIVLPEDTDEANFFERLCVALTALKGAEGEHEEPPVEETGSTFMSTLGGKRGLAALVRFGKRLRRSAAKGVTMSTATTDPTTRALLARVEADDKAKRLARIDALVERGLPLHRAKKLREAAAQVRFALAADGKPAKEAVDEQLDLLDDTLPPRGYGVSLATATEEEPPEETQSGPAKWSKLAEEQAKHSRLPARAAAK